jgi:GNAT superfamily N-acetyltransferase
MSSPSLSITQFLSAWRLLAAAAPTRRLASEPGIDYAFSGVPLAFFNAAVLTGQAVTSEALREYGRRAKTFADDAGVPWVLFVTHDTLAPGTDALATLYACGYAPLMPMTGMRADRVAPAAATPAGLTLREPEDDAGCTQMIDVNAAAYQMPLAEANPVWGVRRFWNDHTAVLGTADGVPVSCSVVWMVDGHRYVAMVATDPGHQRKGYAEAAMRTALELARQRHGEAPTFLHATDAGRPVYTRMGYEAVASHTLFMEKRFLEGH